MTSTDPPDHALTRTMAAARLEARREQHHVLSFERRELRQTRQDTTAVDERLAALAAEIARLERDAGPG